MTHDSRSRRAARIVALAALVGLGVGPALVAAPASATPAASGVSATAVKAPEQEIYLGTERDKCSGNLYVRDRWGSDVFIPRGSWTRVDVAIDGNSYWYWRCGNTWERSRGSNRVKRLYVYHSTSSRSIWWDTYDLLP